MPRARAISSLRRHICAPCRTQHLAHLQKGRRTGVSQRATIKDSPRSAMRPVRRRARPRSAVALNRAPPLSLLRAASAARALPASPDANMHVQGPTHDLFPLSPVQRRRRISRAPPGHDCSHIGPRKRCTVSRDARAGRCGSACLHSAYFLAARTPAPAVISRGGKMLFASAASAPPSRAGAVAPLGAQRSPSMRRAASARSPRHLPPRSAT